MTACTPTVNPPTGAEGPADGPADDPRQGSSLATSLGLSDTQPGGCLGGQEEYGGLQGDARLQIFCMTSQLPRECCPQQQEQKISPSLRSLLWSRLKPWPGQHRASRTCDFGGSRLGSKLAGKETKFLKPSLALHWSVLRKTNPAVRSVTRLSLSQPGEPSATR